MFGDANVKSTRLGERITLTDFQDAFNHADRKALILNGFTRHETPRFVILSRVKQIQLCGVNAITQL